MAVVAVVCWWLVWWSGAGGWVLVWLGRCWCRWLGVGVVGRACADVDVDVLVVGGGPVGLCLAAELAGLGVGVLVVEVRESVEVRPKATVLHARSVQCLVRRGYGGDVVPVEWGTPAAGMPADGASVGWMSGAGASAGRLPVAGVPVGGVAGAGRLAGVGAVAASGVGVTSAGVPAGVGAAASGVGVASAGVSSGGVSASVGASAPASVGVGALAGASVGVGASVETGVGCGVSSVFHFGGLGGLVISAPVGEPVPVVRCVQAELEVGFERRARLAGARVVRGVSVTDVVVEGDGVRVVGCGPLGWVSWRASFVVGADGGRGVVRELGGFGCRSWPASVRALMGWVRPVRVGDLVEGWHRTRRGWVVVKGAGDGGVHVRTLNCSGGEAEGVRGRPVSLGKLGREVSWIVGRDVVLGEGRWLSRFSDFSRVAGSFRRGRVLLAGDAAHVHFPVGGQGLSTGLLDAVNLGWKLALCVRGGAGEGLLDSYDVERRAAALRVVDNTRAQLALMRPGAELDPLRELVGGLMRDGGAGGLGEMVSAQDTVLPVAEGSSSPCEGRFLRNGVLRTGRGVTDVIGLLRGGAGPVLLLAGKAGKEGAGFAEQVGGWSGVVRVVRVASVPGVDCEALLVRPDGYIAWASDGGRGLDAALTALLGPGRAATVPPPAAGPAAGQAAGPVAGQAAGPVAGQAAGPVAGQAAGPVAGPVGSRWSSGTVPAVR
ncbi:FAD-dependent monooxygenase [Streptomyces sp. NBC_00638]|uniref:FAD-dependent monooxygenase n=1 Tax=Streptomyces sp. NBC_00638 TaxID=2975794 RepID=UPI002B1D7776|nr:FAD-dependent monooxygenase [Streptomyces sp. NBC_00638]